MNVEIPPELEPYVDRELAEGGYQSREDLVRDALTVFRELRQRHESLRADVQKALDQPARVL